MLLDRHRERVLHARGISDRVIEGAPMRYESFQRDEWDRFLHFMRKGYATKAEKRVWKGKVAQSGGIVIRRFGVGSAKPRPYARFDFKVAMGPNKASRYIYSKGKHIDVHPLAAGRLMESGEVYFCLEGSLKADAVLSAGAVSFSSSSVTMWETNDLGRLLRQLKRNAMVYVVPDSDYYASSKFEGGFNPMVLWQTRTVAQRLVALGVRVAIRVPWLGTSHEKVGVDDYLAAGYSLSDLSWESPHRAPLSLTGYKLTRSQAKVLTWLTEHQGAHGVFYPSHVAAALGIDRATVRRAYQRFEELGIMRVWEGETRSGAEGPRTAPHVYRLVGNVEASYSSWLDTLPVPQAVHP